MLYQTAIPPTPKVLIPLFLLPGPDYSLRNVLLWEYSPRIYSIYVNNQILKPHRAGWFNIRGVFDVYIVVCWWQCCWVVLYLVSYMQFAKIRKASRIRQTMEVYVAPVFYVKFKEWINGGGNFFRGIAEIRQIGNFFSVWKFQVFERVGMKKLLFYYSFGEIYWNFFRVEGELCWSHLKTKCWANCYRSHKPKNEVQKKLLKML